jgi:methyl halide transferase
MITRQRLRKLSLFLTVDVDRVHLVRFFVAIPPCKRAHWGHQMNALIKPGGFLITLVFPLDSPQEYGPPFYVQPEHYIEPLGSQKWEKVIDKAPENSLKAHIGRERLVVWKKL